MRVDVFPQLFAPQRITSIHINQKKITCFFNLSFCSFFCKRSLLEFSTYPVLRLPMLLVSCYSKGIVHTTNIEVFIDEYIRENFADSKRVLHYKEFLNNKRIYEKHSLEINRRVNVGEIGNKSMGINSPVLFSISSKTVRARSSVRLERRTLNP